jgi:hypothetical protein
MEDNKRQEFYYNNNNNTSNNTTNTNNNNNNNNTDFYNSSTNSNNNFYYAPRSFYDQPPTSPALLGGDHTCSFFPRFSDINNTRTSSTTSTTASTTAILPGERHPSFAGEVLDNVTVRCECGGKTGICGTPEGNQKWRTHQRTQKHSRWMTNSAAAK